MAGHGQPLKFSSPEELQKKIDAYFAMCDEKGKPYTITGLAVFLDTTRETIMDYAGRDNYSDTVRKAKLKIHSYAEESLWTARNATGIIFNLKNNYPQHWKDRQEIQHEGIQVQTVNYAGAHNPTPKTEDADSSSSST